MPVEGHSMNLVEQVTHPLVQEYNEIPLTQDKVALVDASDYSSVAGFNWYARKNKHTWYAIRSEGQKKIYLHRQILGFPPVNTDHRDGDGLNCRRYNLRQADGQQNGRNHRLNRNSTSGFKGVSWDKGRSKWRAYIVVDGKQIHLGRFDTAEEAARAYDAAALERFGEFAKMNFMEIGNGLAAKRT
jgi:AP2 domain